MIEKMTFAKGLDIGQGEERRKKKEGEKGAGKKWGRGGEERGKE